MSICKSYDEQVYRKFKIDEDGLYYNARMEKETNLRRAYSESRKRNVSGSKSDKKQTTASHVQSTSKTYASHMENEDEDINVNVNIDINRIIKREQDKAT